MSKIPDNWSRRQPGNTRALIGERLDSIEATQEQQGTDRTPVFQNFQTDLNVISSPPTSWTDVLDQAVVVPAGYSTCQVFMGVLAGMTVSGTSNGVVGVQPVLFDGSYGYAGPAISNGTPGAGSVTAPSYFSVLATGLAAGATVTLSVYAYFAAGSGSSVVTSSANAHLSATCIFLR